MSFAESPDFLPKRLKALILIFPKHLEKRNKRWDQTLTTCRNEREASGPLSIIVDTYIILDYRWENFRVVFEWKLKLYMYVSSIYIYAIILINIHSHPLYNVITIKLCPCMTAIILFGVDIMAYLTHMPHDYHQIHINVAYCKGNYMAH